MHGDFGEFPIGVGVLAQPTRLQELREIAAAQEGQTPEDENGVQRDENVRLALALVKKWVADNAQRFDDMLDTAAAGGCWEIPLFRGADFFTWLLVQPGMNAAYLCTFDSTSRISCELVVLLREALKVPIKVTFWAFYASLKLER